MAHKVALISVSGKTLLLVKTLKIKGRSRVASAIFVNSTAVIILMLVRIY